MGDDKFSVCVVTSQHLSTIRVLQMTLPHHGHTCHLHADAGEEERLGGVPSIGTQVRCPVVFLLLLPQLVSCCFESGRVAVAHGQPENLAYLGLHSVSEKRVG